jgi:hypothetical protein
VKLLEAVPVPLPPPPQADRISARRITESVRKLNHCIMKNLFLLGLAPVRDETVSADDGFVRAVVRIVIRDRELNIQTDRQPEHAKPASMYRGHTDDVRDRPAAGVVLLIAVVIF